MPNNLTKIFRNFWDKSKLVYCLFIPPLVVLLPGIMQYPFPPSSSQHSDMVISHFPNAYYLADSLVRWKQIPLWSPTILSGYPFVANPLSGYWYLPNWLAVILPLPMGINLLILAHLVWGGIGVFQMLKQEGLSNFAAMFGGMAFELMPKLLAHYGAGHISLIMAVCWTPWLIVSAQGVGNNENDHPSINFSIIRHICFPAFVLSSIIMADIRWIGFAGLLWVSYLLMVGLKRESRIENAGKSNENRITCTSRYLTGKIILPAAIALGLTAPFLLPFFEYVQLSTRTHLTSAENLVFSLPPAKLLGLIFPPFGDYYEWIVYPGIMVFILAGVCWVIKNPLKYKIYWSAVFIITLIFALGLYLPGSSWLARIPGISFLRVPSRILFITEMALGCLAARGLDEILYSKGLNGLKTTKLILVSLVGFLFFINIGAALVTSRLVSNLLWSLVFGTLSVLVIWMLLHRNQPIIWVIAILGVSFFDWMLVDRSLFSFRSSQEVFSSAEKIVQFLSKDNDLYRVYSPSYSLPQQVATVHDIQLADGIDPLQLESYVNFMEEATGITQEGYSVTLPSFKTGDPAVDNQKELPDPELLGLINVKYVVSEFDIEVGGLEIVAQFDQSRVYQNQYWLPRAWLQLPGESIGKNISRVNKISWSPNRIQITLEPISKPQELVLSELSYPGWRVFVDEQEKPIILAQNLLRGVEIQPGDKVVEFRFQPKSLTLGIFIFIITILLIAGTIIYYGYRSRK